MSTVRRNKSTPWSHVGGMRAFTPDITSALVVLLTQALCGGGGRVCAESQKATQSSPSAQMTRSTDCYQLLADQLVECEIVGALLKKNELSRGFCRW